jgi:hypothetical protein
MIMTRGYFQIFEIGKLVEDPQKDSTLNGNNFAWIVKYFQESCYNW